MDENLLYTVEISNRRGLVLVRAQFALEDYMWDFARDWKPDYDKRHTFIVSSRKLLVTVERTAAESRA